VANVRRLLAYIGPVAVLNHYIKGVCDPVDDAPSFFYQDNIVAS
jgi:hypothetical protein